jgi:tRNA pseudouridine55 synthase
VNLLTQQNLNSYSQWLAQSAQIGGFILVDKPLGPTSFGMVQALRKITKIKAIGHAGTLDPLASGLLIVALGKATKQLTQFQSLPKGYTFTIKLGATTQTDDAQMPEEHVVDVSHIAQSHVYAAVAQFDGTIIQTPPIYSAIKVNGQRAYDMARNDLTPELQPRALMIYSLKVTDISLPYVSLEVWCSKGTYVRSLARDIGRILGCGAYVTTLRRIAIGLYMVDKAVDINLIAEKN